MCDHSLQVAQATKWEPQLIKTSHIVPCEWRGIICPHIQMSENAIHQNLETKNLLSIWPAKLIIAKSMNPLMVKASGES